MQGNNQINGNSIPKSILLTSKRTPTINDKINHPSHYTDGNIEGIEAWEGEQKPWLMDLTYILRNIAHFVVILNQI